MCRTVSIQRYLPYNESKGPHQSYRYNEVLLYIGWTTAANAVMEHSILAFQHDSATKEFRIQTARSRPWKQACYKLIL